MYNAFDSYLSVAVVSTDDLATGAIREQLAIRAQRAYVFADLETLWQAIDVRTLDLIIIDLRDAQSANTLLRRGWLNLPATTVVCGFGRYTAALPACVVLHHQPSDDELCRLLELASRQRWPHVQVPGEIG